MVDNTVMCTHEPAGHFDKMSADETTFIQANESSDI